MPGTIENGTANAAMPHAVYGFIGLGNMGFGMAKNLRESMPKDCKLLVCELNTARRKQFVSSVGGLVETAESPKEIAEQCVCRPNNAGPGRLTVLLLGHHYHKSTSR